MTRGPGVGKGSNFVFLNRWHDPAYRSVRAELHELMLEATIRAADPKPERIAAC